MSKLTSLFVVGGLTTSAALGYYLRGLTVERVMPLASYFFSDQLADSRAPYLLAQGTWYGAGLANRINTVRLFCDSVARTCEMNQADVYGLTGSQEFLNLHSTSFRFNHLDSNTLTAVSSDALCVRQTLVIDRQAKSVSLVRTKINKTEICAAVQDEPFTINLGDPLTARKN